MKKTGLALVAALLCSATAPARADDEGPAATACMMQQIGFRAAPCMTKYMKTLGNAPNMQLAARTAALEEQVRSGRISNRDAYTRYVAIRNEVHSAEVRANIGAALGAFATGFAGACHARPPATASVRPCSVKLGNPRVMIDLRINTKLRRGKRSKPVD